MIVTNPGGTALPVLPGGGYYPRPPLLPPFTPVGSPPPYPTPPRTIQPMPLPGRVYPQPIDPRNLLPPGARMPPRRTDLPSADVDVIRRQLIAALLRRRRRVM